MFFSARIYFPVHKYVTGGQVTIVFPRLTGCNFAPQRPSQPDLKCFLIPSWKACLVPRVDSCPGGFCCWLSFDIYQRTQPLQQLIFNAHGLDFYFNSLCVVKTEINTNRTSISKAKIAETKPVKETNLLLLRNCTTQYCLK